MISSGNNRNPVPRSNAFCGLREKGRFEKDKIAGALVVTRRVGAAQARSLLFGFCLAQGMIVAGGAIGYGREPGDVRTGVGGGIDMSAMDEARLLGTNVVRLARKLGRL